MALSIAVDAALEIGAVYLRVLRSQPRGQGGSCRSQTNLTALGVCAIQNFFQRRQVVGLGIRLQQRPHEDPHRESVDMGLVKRCIVGVPDLGGPLFGRIVPAVGNFGKLRAGHFISPYPGMRVSSSHGGVSSRTGVTSIKLISFRASERLSSHRPATISTLPCSTAGTAAACNRSSCCRVGEAGRPKSRQADQALPSNSLTRRRKVKARRGGGVADCAEFGAGAPGALAPAMGRENRNCRRESALALGTGFQVRTATVPSGFRVTK